MPHPAVSIPPQLFIKAAQRKSAGLYFFSRTFLHSRSDLPDSRETPGQMYIGRSFDRIGRNPKIHSDISPTLP